MSHKFFEGTIYHKRFLPKEHSFKYNFFMLDIDLRNFDSLKNRFFSKNKFNLFSFKSIDHFGKSTNFLTNIDEILKEFNIKKSSKIHFITLPRIMNFVFNPISILITYENNKPKNLLAEVHNYNGGRVVYPIELSNYKDNKYKGKIKKDMYVSPFFGREGDYEFLFEYDENTILLKIDLFENNKKMLTAFFDGKSSEFSSKNVLKLFFKYSFLTFFVVLRTIIQSIKLYKLGLTWNKVTKIDQVRRY